MSNVASETKRDAFKELVRLRDRAQAYAEKAAPYVHPTLHAVAPLSSGELQKAIGLRSLAQGP